MALSGGGVEPGERIEEALRREIREELGEQLLLTEITPWTFSDDIRTKTYADGRKEEIYMIYLIFDCVSANREVKINEEFQDYAWVKPEDLAHYDLNVATRKTLRLKRSSVTMMTAITGCQIENLVVNEFPIQINFAFFHMHD
ncbi:NUDIX-family hydrolase [Escherichia coli]|uniref:NUDIX-family hydrolase n=1 Tax=Escherichia coli TaxID=562 RepID=A0A376L7X1_ECOLX|nr:NUDIX-family hydrolase [Escherichia coli]